ncbi:MAG: type II toxin-antitoxin system RelE/ParE family toxin [Pseudomonadota bacterium]
MKILWSPAAHSDLLRLHDFLKNENPEAALMALKSIKENITKIADFPNIGVQISAMPSWREFYIPFGRQAYVVRYVQTSPTVVFIIRVWHSRENRPK